MFRKAVLALARAVGALSASEIKDDAPQHYTIVGYKQFEKLLATNRTVRELMVLEKGNGPISLTLTVSEANVIYRALQTCCAPTFSMDYFMFAPKGEDYTQSSNSSLDKKREGVAERLMSQLETLINQNKKSR